MLGTGFEDEQAKKSDYMLTAQQLQLKFWVAGRHKAKGDEVKEHVMREWGKIIKDNTKVQFVS